MGVVQEWAIKIQDAVHWVRPNGYGSKTWHVIYNRQHISVNVQLSCGERYAAIQLFPECITMTRIPTGLNYTQYMPLFSL
jgi:hypothetical protein